MVWRLFELPGEVLDNVLSKLPEDQALAIAVTRDIMITQQSDTYTIFDLFAMHGASSTLLKIDLTRRILLSAAYLGGEYSGLGPDLEEGKDGIENVAIKDEGLPAGLA